MPDLAMSMGVRRRTRGSVRPSDLFNMFLEADEQSPDGFARHSRPGTSVHVTVGDGPVQGSFSEPGVFSGARFVVSGNDLFRAANELGTIDGNEAVSFAASKDEILVTMGRTAYSYIGTTLEAVDNNDEDLNPYDVRALAYLGGYFFAVEQDTHRIYWSSSGDGRTWSGLDFVSAESEADPLLDLYVVNDALWAMGERTVEVFQLTGDADAVIARAEGMLLKKGIVAPGAACEADNTLYWWGHDGYIYRAGQGQALRVSDNGIEEMLEGSSLKSMFSFTFEGHVFVVVRCDEGTFVLDVSLPQPVWAEWGTYGRTGWRMANAVVHGSQLLFGDDTDGKLWKFDASNWDDATVQERRWSASFNSTTPIIVYRLCIVGNAGDTPLLTGQGSDPVIEIRASRDNGRTWEPWRSVKFGPQGKYRKRIEKRRWGLFDPQGGLFQFRVTDPVPVRISRVYANEPSGGRGGGS